MSHAGASTRPPGLGSRSPGIVSAQRLIPAAVRLVRSEVGRGSEHALRSNAFLSKKLCRVFITAVNALEPVSYTHLTLPTSDLV